MGRRRRGTETLLAAPLLHPLLSSALSPSPLPPLPPPPPFPTPLLPLCITPAAASEVVPAETSDISQDEEADVACAPSRTPFASTHAAAARPSEVAGLSTRVHSTRGGSAVLLLSLLPVPVDGVGLCMSPGALEDCCNHRLSAATAIGSSCGIVWRANVRCHSSADAVPSIARKSDCRGPSTQP